MADSFSGKWDVKEHGGEGYMKKKTQNEFENDVKKVNADLLILGEYINNATKILTKCKKCGRVWKAVPTKLIVEYKCPLCEKQKRFMLFLKEHDLVSLTPYVDKKAIVKIKCIKCNQCWESNSKKLKRDSRCPFCSNKKSSVRWTKDLFQLKMKELYSSSIVPEEYIAYDSKVKCHCVVCGGIFFQSPHTLLNGRGCPVCNGYRRWTEEEFQKRLKNVDPMITASEFAGIKKRVRCKCRICGYEWNPQAGDVIRGHGCPKCHGHARLDFKQFK